MKLIRFGEMGYTKPGVIIGDAWYDVSDFVKDYDEAFFSGDGIQRLKRSVELGWLKEVEHTRLCAPVARPSKIICVGLNYKEHAKETGMEIPAEPVLFLKATSAIVGPNDDLVIPKKSTKTDWEAELGVVIGKKARYVPLEEANDHIAGYLLHNDYSEREFQLERGGQWDKGKGCDTFAPLGPFLATPDEIEDVHNLEVWLKVNGKTMQRGNTSDLIFNIPFLIHYISQFMTLLPGDMISTGTPAGVGLGQKPEPWYLQPGDVVELGIDGLGESKQAVKYLED